jgi:hypothetical protein
MHDRNSLRSVSADSNAVNLERGLWPGQMTGETLVGLPAFASASGHPPGWTDNLRAHIVLQNSCRRHRDFILSS